MSTGEASFGRVGTVGVCPTLPLWMRRLAGDVVVLHEPNPMALLAYAIVRPTVRLVIWYHSEVLRPRWRYRLFYAPFLAVPLRRASRIVGSGLVRNSYLASSTQLASSPITWP